MPIIQEVEKVIAELPIHEATMLRFWLGEFKAARQYKKLKAYTMANKTLVDFQGMKGNSSLN